MENQKENLEKGSITVFPINQETLSPDVKDALSTVIRGQQKLHTDHQEINRLLTDINKTLGLLWKVMDSAMENLKSVGRPCKCGPGSDNPESEFGFKQDF